MRDYARVSPRFWTDHKGKQWKVSTIRKRLKFCIPSHAALRAYIFWRDGYRCTQCGVTAINAPVNYDGRHTLATEQNWCLVMDHKISHRNGGTHHPDNLITLCDSCNARKAALVDSKQAAPIGHP